MIIRISRFEAVILSAVLVTVSFLLALNFEEKVSTVSTNENSVSLPILMYHHITDDDSKTGKYTVHTDEFDADLKFIEENGYTTITVEELYVYICGEGKLPDKPIMITFDDGFESFYTLAFPLLKQYNSKAVVSVIGSVTEKYSEINDHNINYSNLTWAEITELHNSGLVEIQNHSYDMHKSEKYQRKGISKTRIESAEEYSENLTADLTKLQNLLEENCGFTPNAVAYPYGAYSKNTLEIIKKCGFICSLGCEEKVNKIVYGDKDCLFNLGRYNRESGVTTKEFFERMQ